MILLIRYQKLFISFLLFLLVFCTVVKPYDSSASAWLQPKGEYQLLLPVYQIVYDKYYNINGDTRYQSALTKIEFKPYIEYGLLDYLSVGFSPSFQAISSVASFGSDDNLAFAYSELFYKYQIYNSSSLGVFSFEQKLEIPGIYNEKYTPTFGKKEFLISNKILYGNTVYLNPETQRKLFLNLEIGVKSKLDELVGNESGSMFEADLTIGYKYSDDMEVFLQPSMKKAMSTYKNNLSILDKYGYDIYKFELSFVKKFKDYDVQASLLKDIDGVNTGAGDGYMLSINKKF